ncbi:S9 family peptidase [Tenuifilum sp.]|uniref:S9 family peptidase n=1 Tax=Tenuifilum sp. TaxID=2760880 RepID=UPI002CE257A6|nr:S9 family peptidase [Tenuifilum sp.]HQG72536.1 S9 family peptidase [Tenuifilum sp.]HQI87746.1 S9 family peptidase [Tenuifilum sp.]
MKRFFLTFFIITLVFTAFGQKELTLEQAVLRQGTEFRPKTLPGFSWLPGTDEYSFVSNDSLIIVNVTDSKKNRAVTLSEVNEALKANSLQPLKRVPSAWGDGKQLRFIAGNYFVLYNSVTKSIASKFLVADNSENHEFSPGGRWMSYTIGNNLFLTNAQGEVITVTNDTTDGIVNGQSVHRNEFGINKGTFWSPSGRYLAYYHMDESMVTKYPLVDISKRVGELVNIRYPMAGMQSHVVTVRVYDTQSGSTVELKTGEPRDQYLTNIAWTPDERSILIAVLNREQNHMCMNRYNVSTGDFELTLFEESSSKYVEPLEPPFFINSNSFLWLSRRDGWNHIYLYLADGKFVKQLTKGEWEVTSIDATDFKNGLIYFTSTKESPLDRHLYSVSTKNGSITKLTTSSGTHRCMISPSYKYFVDFYSSITVPNRVALHTIKGKLVKQLIDAPNPYTGYNVSLPNLITLTATDGTTLYGRMIKPVNFDSTQKYPVVIYVYGGPHSQLVTNSWMGGARLWECYMANKGYILFTLDNRGTSNRGAQFEQAIHRQLGTVELGDQLVGVNYLKSLPYVDSTRLGVHGWSFGGFMTITMMLRASDHFKVGVAGGPVTDWKFYEVMYGERYMDTPDENPDGYKKADLKNYVTNLKGKLLIIHDDMDKTVVPQHSLTLIHEFIKNGVQVDFFMYPQHDHNVMGKDRVHLIDKIIRYFDDNL